jgi:hypothetical protein
VSRSSKSCAIERSASRWLLRWTSVGCAVKTGDTRLRPSTSAIASIPKPGRGQALEDGGKAARLAGSRLLHSANSTAPDIVPVLSNVGKMREISKSAQYRHRLIGGQSAQERAELTTVIRIGVAFEGDTQLSDGLCFRFTLLMRMVRLCKQHMAWSEKSSSQMI